MQAKQVRPSCERPNECLHYTNRKGRAKADYQIRQMYCIECGHPAKVIYVCANCRYYARLAVDHPAGYSQVAWPCSQCGAPVDVNERWEIIADYEKGQWHVATKKL
jgi:hypothetical protein